MRNTLLVLFAFALVIVQSALSTLVSTAPFTPLAVLPMALYLGVTPDVTFARGVLLAFVLGVVSDELTGAPLGYATSLFVSTFLLARVAAFRLFLRGVAFQIGSTTGITMIALAAMLALCAILGDNAHEPFALEMVPRGVFGSMLRALGVTYASRLGLVSSMAERVVAPAIATGLISPLIYAVVRRIEAFTLRTRSREVE